MKIGWTLIAVAIAATLAVATFAGEFVEYPEFRYTSALPGGGWGVTPDGVPGFDGALQTNIPVAYTPHCGTVLGYSSGSFDSTPRFRFSGGNSNGTATIAMGFGKPGHGIYLCEMGTARNWESVQNLQFQIIPASNVRPAVAIGVQDILSQRVQRLGGSEHGAASYYAVATQEYELLDRPVYVTLGAGFRRFHGLFGGVSWRATDKLTIMAEYDGWNVNAGAALDLSDWLVDHVVLFTSMVDLNRTVIGLTYVNSKWPNF